MRISWIKTSYSRQKAGLILILVGLVCFGVIVSLRTYREYTRKILSFSKIPELKEEISEDLFPTQILISKVRIDFPVFPARASGDTWEISEKGVSYLLGTGVPGRKGNVVIFGHNKNNLFGPIRWLEKDEGIELTNKRDEKFIYKIITTKIVSPDEVWVLSPTEDATLTLYTCTGFLDSKRFIVVAKLKVE
mgnify:CR=1 FL=1